MTNHHHHPKWKLALVVLSIAHNPAMIVVNLRQGYDFKEDVTFDLRSDTGFCKGLLLSLRLLAFGLCYGAVPCESFGWMSSGTHQRSSVCPYGNQTCAFVVEGSTFCTRFMIFALISLIRGATWFAENPARTTLTHMPSIQLLMNPLLMPLIVKWPHP